MGEIAKSGSLNERLLKVAEPVVEGFGLELVDLACAVSSGHSVLRVFIDKPGGVTIDDCAVVSRELGAVLDIEDPVPGRYSLEVSSPGLDRPLKREKDFLRFLGRLVKITTIEPLEGRSHFKVHLIALHDGVLKVRDETDTELAINMDNIRKANLVAEF